MELGSVFKARAWGTPRSRPRRVGYGAALAFFVLPALASAELVVDPGSHDFGSALVGSSAGAIDVDLINSDEDEALTISDFQTSGQGCGSFSFDLPETPLQLAPEGVATIGVDFIPVARGEQECRLTFETGAPGQPKRLDVSGTGVGPAIIVDPEEDIAFPDTPVGETSDDETFTIANDDAVSSDLTVSVVLEASGAGSDASSFAVEIDDCPETDCVIAPGDEVTVRVRFSPQDAGEKLAQLVIEHDDPDHADIELELRGTGIEPDAELIADPDPVVFPITRVGETSTEIVTLRNEGEVDLDIEALLPSVSVITVVSAPSTPFSIPAGDAQAITLEFEPVAGGDINAILEVQVAQLDDPLEVGLVAPGRIAEAELSPDDIDFGEVRVDEPATEELLLTNIGSASFEILSIDIDDPLNFEADVASGSLPRVLGPGEDLTFEVVAELTAVGTRQATLSIHTDIPGSQTLTVGLSATGISADLVVSAGAIDFGAHDVRASPAIRVLRVENHPDATNSLDLEGAEILGPGAGVYAVQNAGGIPTTLEPGEGVDVTVAYDPVVVSAGEPQATLVITSDLRVAEVALFGRGIDREIMVSPLSLVFPETYRNSDTPPSRSVVIHNTGEAPLALAGAVVGGADPDAFQLTSELPASLLAGESATVTVLFAPAVASSAPLEARLVFTSNDARRPSVEVELSGRAILPNLSMSPGRVDFGRTGVGVPRRLPTPITIENRDDDEVMVVRDIRLAGGEGSFSLLDWEGEPVELGPRETLDLHLEFAPASSGLHEAYLEVYLGADPERIAVTELLGEGTPFRVRGGGCHAAASGGLASGLLTLFAALALVKVRRRRHASAA
jgi:hypothetical protein